MVLMPVREDDPGEILLLVLDELQVGKDQVDAGIVGAGKGQPQIDHDPLAPAAIQIDVHADLARSAERDEKEFFSGDHLERRAAISYNKPNPWMVRSGSI